MLKYAKLSEEDAFKEFDAIYSSPSSKVNTRTKQTKDFATKDDIEQLKRTLEEIKEKI